MNAGDESVVKPNHVLCCAECGRVDVGERGWTMRLDEDDELHAFCPRCDRREFGDSSRGRGRRLAAGPRHDQP
jgi:hypothetical protein